MSRMPRSFAYRFSASHSRWNRVWARRSSSPANAIHSSSHAPSGRALVALAVVVVLRAGRGEQAFVARERRLRRVRGAVAVGDVERQQLPPRLPRLDEPVDEPVGLLVEPPGRQRRDVQQHAARARTPEHGELTVRVPARSRRRARASTRSSLRRRARPAPRSARRARRASPGPPRRRPRSRRPSARRRSA